jgi:5-methyltetrahydropteroyltriglutamate--homocysteine methyltransferase
MTGEQHVHTQTLGTPRMGRDRELKRALERYWRGEIGEDALMAVFWAVAEDGWVTQRDAGVDYIGVGWETLYDHVLDWAVRFGLVAERFQGLTGLTRTFAMARGVPGIAALEMTKWFDTNYHYLVPVIDAETVPTAGFDDFLALVARAREVLDDRAVPILLGPVTLLRLSRVKGEVDKVLAALLPLYRELVGALIAMGVSEVQIHEPALVLSGVEALREPVEAALGALADLPVTLNLVTTFDDLGEAYPWITQLPVGVLSLDLTRGDNAALIRDHGWPAGKVLAAGVVDTRSVWRIRPDALTGVLEDVSAAVASAEGAALRISTSASLQFVPHTTARETALPDALRGVLAFADEKLGELRAVAAGDLAGADAAWAAFRAFAPTDEVVQARVADLSDDDFHRALPYVERRPRQVTMPRFPMTTIGSFPQTREVRRLRARYSRGEITEAEYHAGIDTFIAYTVGVQDGLGLDMLVHGESERTDMVEYFAQKLTGFAFTEHGWVQSFGSRCVRPPIIYADISRSAPMTVREFAVAQSLTEKPVKGMLTGPVTIINWSYPRVDIPREEIAYQLGLALRDEIADLEAAGAQAIQVDEPALREGMPLKRERWATYLDWAIKSFRLATGRARPETQVHTHMCYSEFGEILDAIDRLDADVISIENARSDDATLKELAAYGYPREVGPGVYDIHSPVVPTAGFVLEKLRSFLHHLPPERIWVNPDCGLKTRTWAEVLPSLQHMVEAVRALRASFEGPAAD